MDTLSIKQSSRVNLIGAWAQLAAKSISISILGAKKHSLVKSEDKDEKTSPVGHRKTEGSSKENSRDSEAREGSQKTGGEQDAAA